MVMTSSCPSPVHEAANAITMLAPSIVLLRRLRESREPNSLLLVLACCTLLHLPVGAGYHAGAALGLYRCPVDNFMRRLDQTVQHLAGIAFSYALSSGSPAYTLVNAVPNVYWAWQIWQPGCQRGRWVYVGVSVALYTLPMLVLRGDAGNYLLAMSSMALGGYAAFVSGNPWGHSAFHLLLGIFAEALASSACKI